MGRAAFIAVPLLAVPSFNQEDVFVAIGVCVVFFLFRLRQILQLSVFIEHAVGGSQHDEFRSSVQLVADFLFLLVEFLYEFLGEHVTFF